MLNQQLVILTAYISVSLLFLYLLIVAFSKFSKARLIAFLSGIGTVVVITTNVVPASASLKVDVANQGQVQDPWVDDNSQFSQPNKAQDDSGTSIEPSQTINEYRVANKQGSIEKYVVVKGDCLWDIAKSHARNNEDYFKLWKKMIEENAKSIKSKNMNLIYPGEQIIITHQ